jgi:hypothetical protein
VSTEGPEKGAEIVPLPERSPSSGHGYVDHEARRMAGEALALLAAHERQCSDRWEQSRDAISGLSSRVWWIIVAMMGGQAAVLAAIFSKAHF